MSCAHENYDEYFEKCTDCGADEEQVIFDSVVMKLEDVIADTFTVTGAYRGYATPEDLQRISGHKLALAKKVASVVAKCRPAEIREGAES
jgi:hypothetical protein